MFQFGSAVRHLRVTERGAYLGTIVTAQRKEFIMGLSIDEFLANRSEHVTKETPEFHIGRGRTPVNAETVQNLLDHCMGLARLVDRMDECCSWDDTDCSEAGSVLSRADDIRNIINSL